MARTPPATYVFEDVAVDRERQRLRAIEGVFDEATKRAIEHTRIAAGWRCLEVGAGAGSIATWLAEVVGPRGSVLALDTNTEFLPSKRSSHFEIATQDIRTFPTDHEYDLVHGRYVLIHIADFSRALERMVGSLKPGGWLVLEEPDFSAARSVGGPAALRHAFDRVNSAIARMFEQRGMDHTLGLKLPRLVEDARLQLSRVENDVPLTPGQSSLALMMRSSAEQLRDKYVGTGVATAGDVDGYCAFADLPSSWGIYYGTVRVVARRSAV